MNDKDSGYNVEEAIRYVESKYQDSRRELDLTSREHSELRTHLSKALELQSGLPSEETLNKVNRAKGNSSEYLIYPSVKNKILPDPSNLKTIERQKLNHVLWVLKTYQTLQKISTEKKTLDDIL